MWIINWDIEAIICCAFCSSNFRCTMFGYRRDSYIRLMTINNNFQTAVSQVRDQFESGDVMFLHRFHPYGLPDTRRRSIIAVRSVFAVSSLAVVWIMSPYNEYILSRL